MSRVLRRSSVVLSGRQYPMTTTTRWRNYRPSANMTTRRCSTTNGATSQTMTGEELLTTKSSTPTSIQDWTSTQNTRSALLMICAVHLVNGICSWTAPKTTRTSRTMVGIDRDGVGRGRPGRDPIWSARHRGPLGPHSPGTILHRRSSTSTCSTR